VTRPARYQLMTLEELGQFKELFRRTLNNPLLFLIAILRVKPRRWQKKLCVRLAERLLRGETHLKVTFRSCHGSGKTWMAAALFLWFMCRAQARGLTTAPTFAGVENLLWPEIRKIYQGSLLADLEMATVLPSKCKILFDNEGWFGVGGTSDKGENLEGHHSPTACVRVIDEAKTVEDDVFTSTEGMLNSPVALDLWLSTPSIQVGKFYQRDAATAGDDVERIHVDIHELLTDPAFTEEERAGLEAWRAECEKNWGIDSPEYQSRVLGLYIENAEGQLYPPSWLERAFELGRQFVLKHGSFEHYEHEREHPRDQRPPIPLPRVVGQDVAGSVDGDRNAQAVVAGPNESGQYFLTSLTAWHERDTMVSKGRLLAAIRNERAVGDARVDTVGIGKGVYDQARVDLGTRAPLLHEYRASDKAYEDDRFENRKAEDGWGLRSLLEHGKFVILPTAVRESELLKAEMRAVKYEITRAGKKRTVDPKLSPDATDALVAATAKPRVQYAAGSPKGF
jgi:hypothetical protein